MRTTATVMRKTGDLPVLSKSMLAARAGLDDEGYCILMALPVVTTSFIRYSNNDLAQMLTIARSVGMPNEGGVLAG